MWPLHVDAADVQRFAAPAAPFRPATACQTLQLEAPALGEGRNSRHTRMCG